jgi:hypothetical protein
MDEVWAGQKVQQKIAGKNEIKYFIDILLLLNKSGRSIGICGSLFKQILLLVKIH